MFTWRVHWFLSKIKAGHWFISWYFFTDIISDYFTDSGLESGAFTTRCPLQGGIPPCNEFLRFTWGGIPPQGEALFGHLLLGDILPRSQSAPMVVARAVCHPGDRKQREEFPRRFKDVHSPSGPENPCCRMLFVKKFVPFVNKRLSVKRADGRL